MLSLILPLLCYFFYRAFSVANPIYLLAYFVILVFCFLFQSKYKEDASATHPILLDEPKFKVCLPPFPIFSSLLCHVSLVAPSPFFF